MAASLVKDLDSGFTELVRVQQDILYAAAYRMTNHRQEAEDLTASCLLNAFRALAGYDSDRLRQLKFRSWLLAILTNVWRNSLRARSRRVRESVLQQGEDPPTTGPGVEHVADRLGEASDLSSRLARLPLRQREAVVLRHVLDLPIAEVAEILRCPEGTAKSHVSRGLSTLRATYPDPVPTTRQMEVPR
jgi:RNA polymerase sigma-70 factor (ECF subfamily)